MGNTSKLPIESKIVAYAMSRLDAEYLLRRGWDSWPNARREAADRLGGAESSYRLHTNEFDPIHPNRRVGFHKRPMRPEHIRIAAELAELSDDALMELVDRILIAPDAETHEIIDALSSPIRATANVAERLLTGRRAEEWFLENCDAKLLIPRESLIDLRHAACGYDFGLRDRNDEAIEVKGMKSARGQIQFTDREWTVACERRGSYRLIVVGNLDRNPVARVWPDPWALLSATSHAVRTTTQSWRAVVEV